MTYDPMDYRIVKTDSKGSLTYLLEGERIDAIMNASQFKADYMRGSVVDEIVNGFQYDPSGNWTNYTFSHDLLMSVVGLSDHEGNLLLTITYDPFGNMMTNVGVGTNNALCYTGRELDPDTGLYYYRARYYSPIWGRFLTEDPKGFKAGVNFYVYAKNNPINANDPTGLYSALWETLPNGGGGWVMTKVKDNPGNILAYGQNAGTPVAVAVPSGVDPQGVVNYWADRSVLSAFQFANYWQAGGPNDYKVNYGKFGPNAAMYDQFGNFLYGDSGSAIGFPGFTLQTMGDLIYYKNHGTANIDINVNDIQSGIDAHDKGATLSVGEYTPHDDWSLGGPPDSDSAAAGGFLIYPNKPNNNMMSGVYRK